MPPKLVASSSDRALALRAQKLRQSGNRAGLQTMNRKALEACQYLSKMQALVDYLHKVGALELEDLEGMKLNEKEPIIDQFASLLRNGVILCRFAQLIAPGSIKRINSVPAMRITASGSPSSSSLRSENTSRVGNFKAVENILFFLEAVSVLVDSTVAGQQISSPTTQFSRSRFKTFSPTDLFEGKNINRVVDTIIEIAELAHSRLNFPHAFVLGSLANYDVPTQELNEYTAQLAHDKIAEANAPPPEEKGRARRPGSNTQGKPVDFAAVPSHKHADSKASTPVVPAAVRSRAAVSPCRPLELTDDIPEAVSAAWEESLSPAEPGTNLSNEIDSSAESETPFDGELEIPSIPDFGVNLEIGDLTDNIPMLEERVRAASITTPAKSSRAAVVIQSNPIKMSSPKKSKGPTNYAEQLRKQTKANKSRWNADLIIDGLWLGDEDAAADLVACQAQGITHILSAIGGEPVHPAHFKYLCINAYDSAEHDILRYLPVTSNFIREARQGGAVLVHCQRGVSRSATMVIAFLMDSLGHDFYDAADIACEKRPVVCPNLGFIKQLQLYQAMSFKLDGDTSHHVQYGILRNRSDLVDARDEFIEAQAGATHELARFLRPTPSAASLNCVCCSHCEFPLANRADIVSHDKPESEPHSVTFVVGMDWMLDTILSSIEGELRCPNSECRKVVGEFDWADGKKKAQRPTCSCGFISTPAFGLCTAADESCASRKFD